MIDRILLTVCASVTTDGDPTDWPGNPACEVGGYGCSLVSADPAESMNTSMPAANDIVSLWMANSDDTLFVRFDTFANTDYTAGQHVKLCLDIIPGNFLLYLDQSLLMLN
jgi:hypothetical protein